MKKFILTMTLCLSLAGCTQIEQQSQIRQDTAREEAAWVQVEESSSKECADRKKPDELNKREVVAAVKCVTTLVNEIVIPVSVNSDLIIKDRSRALKDAKLYAQGKMSKAQWLVTINSRRNAYTEAVSQRAKKAMATARAHDHALALQFLNGVPQGVSTYSPPSFPQYQPQYQSPAIIQSATPAPYVPAYAPVQYNYPTNSPPAFGPNGYNIGARGYNGATGQVDRVYVPAGPDPNPPGNVLGNQTLGGD